MKLFHTTAFIDDTMDCYRVQNFIYAKDENSAKQLFMKKYDDGWNLITNFTILEVNDEIILRR